MVEATNWAGDFVSGLMSEWPEFPFPYGGVDADGRHPPHVEATRGTASASGPRPTCTVSSAADEALIVEFDAHDGPWMLTNMGVSFSSMDYLFRPVTYTPAVPKPSATATSAGSCAL